MLPLDDPRWKELDHRGWSDGERSSTDLDAPYVPEELARLMETPSDRERFQNLWPYLCSEGTAWPAAFGAVPYVVELAKRLTPEQRVEQLRFVGLVVMCSGPGHSEPIHTYLRDSYEAALREALPLVAETLLCQHDANETRYLLATVAALKGQPGLGVAIEDLASLYEQCPRCGELVQLRTIEQLLDRQAAVHHIGQSREAPA